MLFNYTTHFLVLYYFSSSSPTKVRGVREELKLFLFYFFLQKDGGKSEKHNRLFSISHRIFKSTHQLKQTSGNICYLFSAKLLQKSEMRKDIVIELSYRGFSRASDYS